MIGRVNVRHAVGRSIRRSGPGVSAIALAVSCVGFGGCSSPGATGEPSVGPDPVEQAAQAKSADDAADVAVDPLEVLDPGPMTKTSMREHPAGKAWVFDGEGDPYEMAIDQAEARGYTVIDLGDEWRPYIFTHKTPGQEDESDNGYASRYLDLAADRTDRDGDPLDEGQHNYLELYGIPPTLDVVLADWERGEAGVQSCLDESGWDPSVFAKAGPIAYKKSKVRKRGQQARWAKARLDKLMAKAKLTAGDYATASSDAATQGAHAAWRTHQDEVDAITQAQIRLRCEKLYASRGGEGKSKAGEFDSATHHALAAFEKKHALMGWGHFTRTNLDALARTPAQSSYDRMKRVLTERTVTAAGILEDGSARDWKPEFTYKDAAGNEHKLRDMVSESVEVTLSALGLDDDASAKAGLQALRDRAGGDFETLLVAVKLPERPAYYAENMAFHTVIDRGDVWYDFPYDEEGKQLGQPRKRYPHLTLYVKYEGQDIPVVHWRTTIGSWRSEQHDGQEWFAYKNSDVGPRVWKTIMAAPTWIPPQITPTRTLLKRKYKDGKLRTVVNYDETGPSYTSAYGLVAAYHIKQSKNSEGEVVSEFDNQIRTHGSVDYMSILRRYSHGCHRLYNMNAVRLFSFVLQHRDYAREGQTKIGYARAFEHDGRDFRIRLNTRGYKYELIEPIKVQVREGRVRGRRKHPYTELKPKPGVIYDAPMSEDPALTGNEGEEPGSPLNAPL